MNRMKWINPEIPLSVLALKLCEEAAEVGTEVTDGATNPGQIDFKAMQTELDHVDFISDVIRWRITGMAVSGSELARALAAQAAGELASRHLT